jgi:hypothetical protein
LTLAFSPASAPLRTGEHQRENQPHSSHENTGRLEGGRAADTGMGVRNRDSWQRR